MVLVEQQDWPSIVDGWMRQLAEHRASYATPAGYGSPMGHGSPAPFGPGDHGHKGEHHDGRRSGPGMGTAVAAGAAGLAVGVVGGMVAGEVVDEVGDFFEGDEEEEEG
jgi:sporulation-control protein